ncbi:MAG: hypothetical protein QG670_2773 [Thermoproteota archaeon]|nr:hypothetical protein [Thermoproteota archaeon]
MMKINEYNRLIVILGFREVRIDNPNEFLRRTRQRLAHIAVQLIDADYVAGRLHLFFASLNTLKAFEQKQNISESLEVESLLYASCQRQISKAVEMIGLKANTSKIAVLAFLSSNEEAKETEERITGVIHGIQDERVLEVKGKEKIKKLIKVYGITKLELEMMTRNEKDEGEALTRAIIERGALLATRF